MINNKVRVVIIDSGIDRSKNNLKDNVIEAISIKINSKGYIEKTKESVANNDHGTLVASCIKYICNDAEFIDINILDKNLTTDGRVLLKALEEAINHNPDIVHLSLGTTKFKYWFPLKRIVRKLRKNNIIVVSAANNYGLKSYPAYLKGVVGVKGKEVDDLNWHTYEDGFYYAPYKLPKELCYEESQVKIRGTSIAAAYITGYVCEYVKSGNKNIIF